MKKLSNKKNDFFYISNLSPHPFIEINGEGEIISVNDAARNFLKQNCLGDKAGIILPRNIKQLAKQIKTFP